MLAIHSDIELFLYINHLKDFGDSSRTPKNSSVLHIVSSTYLELMHELHMLGFVY